MVPVKTGDRIDMIIIFPGAQYTVYIAVRVEIDVVSPSRGEGLGGYEMLEGMF